MLHNIEEPLVTFKIIIYSSILDNELIKYILEPIYNKCDCSAIHILFTLQEVAIKKTMYMVLISCEMEIK